MKKLTNKKGFTLVEMLIVVAIIAVLAAIAIPSGLNALDKANEATDDANLRTAQALAAVKATEMAAQDNDEDAVFFVQLSANPAVLVPVEDEWTSGEPDGATTADTGKSKAHDAQVIKVEISKYGEIGMVDWFGEVTTTPTTP